MHAIAFHAEDNTVTLLAGGWARRYALGQVRDFASAVAESILAAPAFNPDRMPEKHDPTTMLALKVADLKRVIPIDHMADSVYTLAEQVRPLSLVVASALSSFDPFPGWLARNSGARSALVRLAVSLTVLNIGGTADTEAEFFAVTRYDRAINDRMVSKAKDNAGWLYALVPQNSIGLDGLPWEHLAYCAKRFLEANKGTHPYSYDS